MPYLGNVLTSFNVGTNNINNEAITSEKIAAGAVVNADVNDTASIAGTKISADFGAQNLIVDTNVLFVNAVDDRVGVGTSSPAVSFHVVSSNYQAAKLESTADNADGAYLELYANSASPAANDTLGIISYRGNDSGGNELTYAQIKAILENPTDTAESGAITFNTRNSGTFSERLRIDSAGRLLVGTSASRDDFYVAATYNPQIQNEGTNLSTSMISNVANSNNAYGSYLILGKSRGTTAGSNTLVSNTDTIGIIDFMAADGAKMCHAASIAAIVDGTPGESDMPTRLVFATTADGNSSPAERLRITPSGQLSTGAESSPDVGGGGICLDQNDGDGIILSFKSSDIAHGMTDLDETDTYFSARKVSGAKGGVKFRGYTDAAGGDPAFQFQGFINSDTDSGYVPFAFIGGKKSGTTVTNISSNRRILEVKNADGTRIASFTGTGLTFGNDDAAANALDKYEEGTWTPSLTNGGTVTINNATYTRIGRLVMAYTYLGSISSIPNDGSQFQIEGLPYDVQPGNWYGAGQISYAGSKDVSVWRPLVVNDGDFIYFHRVDGSTASGKNSNFTGITDLILAIWYFTDA